MKKALSVLLAMGMTVSMVAGCGDTADNGSAADNSAASTESGSSAGTQTAASAADIKVGVIYIGDENEGYTAAHMAGIDEMAANLGLSDDQIIEKTTIPEDESCYDAAVDLADQGCNIIFATSFGHETYILQAAARITTSRPATGSSINVKSALLASATMIVTIDSMPFDILLMRCFVFNSNFRISSSASA